MSKVSLKLTDHLFSLKLLELKGYNDFYYDITNLDYTTDIGEYTNE